MQRKPFLGKVLLTMLFQELIILCSMQQVLFFYPKEYSKLTYFPISPSPFLPIHVLGRVQDSPEDR